MSRLLTAGPFSHYCRYFSLFELNKNIIHFLYFFQTIVIHTLIRFPGPSAQHDCLLLKRKIKVVDLFDKSRFLCKLKIRVVTSAYHIGSGLVRALIHQQRLQDMPLYDPIIHTDVQVPKKTPRVGTSDWEACRVACHDVWYGEAFRDVSDVNSRRRQLISLSCSLKGAKMYTMQCLLLVMPMFQVWISMHGTYFSMCFFLTISWRCYFYLCSFLFLVC